MVEKRKKGRLWVAILCIALVFAVLLAVKGFVSCYSNGAVTGVTASKRSDNESELRISYVLPTGGYSVRMAESGEGKYTGDGMISYDGSLGAHRIFISFGEVAPSAGLLMRRDLNGIIHLSNGLRACIASPSDHGFVLTVGSDEPISVEAIRNGALNAVGGTIRITITLAET